MPCLLLLVLLWWTGPALAEGFVCAGSQGTPTENVPPSGVAAKPARISQSGTTGTRHALVLFARFKGDPANPVPSWAADIFNPALPGSFSHFYDTMSFGKLQVRGEVAPRVYESAKPASAYLADDPSEQGRFGDFAQEILRQADQDIDFAQFDDDGLDGVPNSGDDDGVVDAVFLVLDRIPASFLLGKATGIMGLGFTEVFSSSDTGVKGKPIQIFPGQGTIQQGRFFAEAVGSTCHEYGHVLGLPDLYNTEFIGKSGAGPEDDSAGVGAWCLMGWGASGWNGNDGPNSFCAWSRMQLGWASVEEIAQSREELHLGEVGKTGQVYQIPVAEREYFLLEHRTQQSTFYDRHLPGAGLLIWHVSTKGALRVDLECADGKWQDTGYPQGRQPDPQAGSDNLDFWAHDEAYTVRHQGNLGDSPDPFDGVQFRDFTPETNPNSYSLEGTRSVRVEGIHFEAGVALAQVQTDTMHLQVESLWIRDEDHNDMLHLGEKAQVWFRLNNDGGLTVPGVYTVLSSGDSLVHIDQAETRFGDVKLGRGQSPSKGEKYPQVSLTADPGSRRQVPLTLEVFANEIRVAHEDLALNVVSTFRWSGRVRDESGAGVQGKRLSINRYSVTTGKDGIFQVDLPPGRYNTRISDGNFYSFNLTSDLYSELVVLPVYPVSGTVRDPQGQPVPGVKVTAVPQRRDESTIRSGTDSDSQGKYSLYLAKGTYLLSATGAPQLADRNLSNIRIDAPQTVDIDLEQGVHLRAQITDELGTGLPLSLTMTEWPYQAIGSARLWTTDATGLGELAVLPGIYQLGLPQSPLLYSGYWLPVFSDTTIHIETQPWVSVTGRVKDASAIPFLGSSLRIIPPAPYSPTFASIEDDGTYIGQVPLGVSQVVFSGSGREKALQQRLGTFPTTKPQTPETRTADWEVPRGERIEGQLIDTAGREVTDLQLQALSIATGVASRVLVRADGSFRDDLQPGAYELTGIEGGRTFFPLGTMGVPLTGIMSLHRPAGSSLQGRVSDPQGHPVDQALVVLSQRDPILAKVEVDIRASWFYQSGGMVAAALSDPRGYQLHTSPGTYTLAVLPVTGIGIGRMLNGVELAGERTQDLVLPTPEKVYLVYGLIHEDEDLSGGELILQFRDESTGIIAQATDLGCRGYGVKLPPGSYQVRVGLLGPGGGFQKIYDVGAVSIDRDMRWDIDLADAATAVAEEAATKPQGFGLSPNYPNPFNPTTTIRFSLPKLGEAELSIYNLLGQRVVTLVSGLQEAGPQALQWNGRDDAGHDLASGVYFCRLQAGAQVETRKLLLLR